MLKRLLLIFCLSFSFLSVQSQQINKRIVYDWFAGSECATPSNIVTPIISGVAHPSNILTVNTGTWNGSPTSFTYQWYRNNTAIVGETLNTYTATNTDALNGNYLRVLITAFNACGSTSVYSSNFTVYINPLLITQRYYSANLAFKDIAQTIPAISGEGVQSIKEQVTSTQSLNWIGTITGATQKYAPSDYDYNSIDPYPRFYNKEGGFISIENSTPQKFETGTISYSGAFSNVYYVVLLGGTDNEYFFFVSNGGSMRDRDSGTGNNTQIGAFNTLIVLSSANRILPTYVYKKVMIELVRSASGGLQELYINGTLIGSANVGTNNMSEHAWGSNSHNANIAMFKSAIITGARDTTKINYLKKLWQNEHGNLGTSFTSFPYITFNPSGVYNDFSTWNSTTKAIVAPAYVYNYSIPEGNTEVRLYGSLSSTQATAIGQKFLVKKKIKNIDADYTTFFRGIDYGVSAGTPTNVWYWIEIWGRDNTGVMAPISTSDGGFLDSNP